MFRSRLQTLIGMFAARKKAPAICFKQYVLNIRALNYSFVTSSRKIKRYKNYNNYLKEHHEKYSFLKSIVVCRNCFF